MTFEEWKKRPVFVAQCRTWAKAAEMGLNCHPFRALPGYRNQSATLARNRVAEAIRDERRHQSQH
jgi:hypothetical protein